MGRGNEELKKKLEDELLDLEIKLGKEIEDLTPITYNHKSGGQESVGHRCIKKGELFISLIRQGMVYLQELEQLDG